MARKAKAKFRAVATRETGNDAAPREIVHVGDDGKVLLLSVDLFGFSTSKEVAVADIAGFGWTAVPAGPFEPAATDAVRKALVDA